MSLVFGGNTTDRADFGSPAALDNLHASTFSGWTWLYRTGNGTNQHVITKDQTSYSGWDLVLLNSPGEGAVSVLVFRNTSNAQFTSNGSNLVALNTWTFVGWSYDPAGSPQIRIFKGDLGATVAEVSGYATTTAGSGTAKDDSGANLYVGNLQRANTNPFKGRIARVGLATGLLAAADFQRIQFTTAPETRPSGFVWGSELLDTGTQVDLSGAGNNGSVTGAVVGDHLPLMAPFAVTDGWRSGGSSAAPPTTIVTGTRFPWLSGRQEAA